MTSHLFSFARAGSHIMFAAQGSSRCSSPWVLTLCPAGQIIKVRNTSRFLFLAAKTRMATKPFVSLTVNVSPLFCGFCAFSGFLKEFQPQNSQKHTELLWFFEPVFYREQLKRAHTRIQDQPAADLFRPVRAFRGTFFNREKREMPQKGPRLDRPVRSVVCRARAKAGMFEGDLVEGELEIGQVSAAIDRIQPAAEILEDIMNGYRVGLAALARTANTLPGS